MTDEATSWDEANQRYLIGEARRASVRAAYASCQNTLFGSDTDAVAALRAMIRERVVCNGVPEVLKERQDQDVCVGDSCIHRPAMINIRGIVTLHQQAVQVAPDRLCLLLPRSG